MRNFEECVKGLVGKGSGDWNVPGKYWPQGEIFSTEAVKFRTFVLAETLKACASISLHLMAESASVSSGGQFSCCRGRVEAWLPEKP